MVYHPTGKVSVIVAGSNPEMTYLATTILAKYSELTLENKIAYLVPEMNKFSTGAPIIPVVIQPASPALISPQTSQPTPVQPQVLPSKPECNGCEINNYWIKLMKK